MVRTDDLNMSSAAETNATFQLVQLAQPSNVDTVIVDGRLLKHGGRLIGVDAREVGENAARVQHDLVRRSGHTRISAML